MTSILASNLPLSGLGRSISLAFLLLAAGRGGADTLDQPFDAALLDQSELSVLQVGLSRFGTYDGMIDGRWGPASQAALARTCAGEPSCPSQRTAEALAARVHAVLEDEGWAMHYIPALDMSFLAPEDHFIEDPTVPSASFTLTHKAPDILIVAGLGPLERAEGLGSKIMAQHLPGTETYSVDRKDRRVWAAHATAAGLAEGMVGDDALFYMRSDRHGEGHWSSIVLIAGKEARPVVAMVAGSISVGRAPAIQMPPDGVLAQWVAEEDHAASAPAFSGAQRGISQAGQASATSDDPPLDAQAMFLSGFAAVNREHSIAAVPPIAR